MFRLILIIVLIISVKAFALDYDVDWPSSDNPSKYHTLRISIDGCDTIFKIPLDKLDAFANSTKALSQAIELAEIRAKNGCK